MESTDRRTDGKDRQDRWKGQIEGQIEGQMERTDRTDGKDRKTNRRGQTDGLKGRTE